MAPREQLNLRLPPEWFEVLGVAATFERTSVPEYVRAAIAAKVAQLERDPDVRAVLEILARRRKAEEDGNVTRLEPRNVGDESA